MKSQNGWPVISSAGCWTGPRHITARKGAVWIIFLWFTRRYAAEVEPIGAQSGGHNRRRIAGSAKWSNHASGTALDINWSKHPVGGKYTGFSPYQIHAIRQILTAAGGVIRWGGPAFNDPMHFEIAPNATSATVERLRVILLQRALKTVGIDPGPIDGKRGARTRKAVRTYRRRKNLRPLISADDNRAVWLAIDTDLGGHNK